MKRVATPEEVWASIKELTEAQKASREEWDHKFEQERQESIRRQQESDRAFEQQKKEWDRKFEQERQESIRRQQERDREFEKRQKEQERAFEQQKKEWDRKFEQEQQESIRRQQERDLEYEKLRISGEKVDKQIAKTSKSIARLEKLFVGQWGKLMEQLVKGDFIKLLNQRNIKVDQLSQSTSGVWNDKPYEFDIVAINGSEVVVAEVKTTLYVGDVNDFLEKLIHFKEMSASYSDKKVYGAVAYLKVNGCADVYAERAGLFVVRAVGSSASLTNRQDFVPKNFG